MLRDSPETYWSEDELYAHNRHAEPLFRGDENAAKDMPNFIRGCTEIINLLGCAIMLLHHPSKGGTGGARGHSALNGAADIGLEIKNGKKDIFTVKMDAKPPKDDEPAPDLTLQIKIIDLSDGYGLDTQDKPITSLVLKKVDVGWNFCLPHLKRKPLNKDCSKRCLG